MQNELLDRIHFVLVGTTHPGNIGATARAMTATATPLVQNDIAAQLFVSRATVRTHLEHIYEKLEVTTEGLRGALADHPAAAPVLACIRHSNNPAPPLGSGEVRRPPLRCR